MNKDIRYNILAYLDLLIAIIFPIIALFLVRNYPVNVVNGIILIFILAIFSGLLLPNVIVGWPVILLTTIAAGFLLIGYRY